MFNYSVNEEDFSSLLVSLANKDIYTVGHQRRVAQLSVAMAKDLQLNPNQITDVYTAAILHDIGKLYVPSRILNKPSCLDLQELELIRLHPEKGANLLRSSDSLYPCAEIVLQHHEKLDGSGYPKGLTSENILPAARIIGVADIFDALVYPRPYRSGWGIHRALDEVSRDVGICYDMDAVNSLRRVFGYKPLYLN